MGDTVKNIDNQNFLFSMLSLMVTKNASDLFLTSDFPPAIKINGQITPISSTKLDVPHLNELAKILMNDKQLAEFEATNECNFAIHPVNIGRFRVNAFRQQCKPGFVLRTINTVIPKFEELSLPPVLKDISMVKRGLVIFVGSTGSGKSTSLASMVDYRNENQAGHIITIEDPIEFVHQHKRSIMTQREVGTDTEDWGIALKNTLRQAPDVILIGEIRDKETMDYAIAFAETGHLCLSTLHANNANQALDRILNFFPHEKRQQLLMDLSLNLKAFISQRLLPTQDGKSRIPAVEVLLNSPFISDLIFKGEIHELKEAMKRSKDLGMQTFDMALVDLYERNLISYEVALKNADSLNEVRLAIKLNTKRGEPKEQGGINLQIKM